MILVEGLKMRAPPSREVGSCINPQLAFVHKVKLSQGRRNEHLDHDQMTLFQVPLFKLTTAFRKNSWPDF